MEPTAPVVAPPAAPAQSAAETTVTVTATQAAVSTDNTGAYREARRAERIGKPLPNVKAEAAAPAQAATAGAPATPAAPAQSAVSNRQQEINDRIRDAVTRVTAEKDAEIARLRGTQPAPATSAAPVQPAAETVPEWKRIAALPDAPKIDDFESISEHAAAMALFVNQTVQSEARTRTEGEQLAHVETERVMSFDARVNEVAKVDPEIVSKILPLAQELGKASGPKRIVGNVALASEMGPQLLRYLGERPDELTRLTTLPEHLRKLPLKAAVAQHVQWMVKEIGKLEAKLDTPSAPATSQPKTLSDAPEPPQTLGTRAAEATDPIRSAVRRQDTGAYRQLRREQRAAAMRR